MSNAYLFTLQPTFTQGLVLGQFTILFLLVLILKYLFFDTSSEYPHKIASYQPQVDRDELGGSLKARLNLPLPVHETGKTKSTGAESAEWLNVLLQHVVDSYRARLRDDLPGVEGDDIARQRVENYANKVRPPGFLDPIKVHSVDLGTTAPRLSSARLKPKDSLIEFDMNYVDSVSISFSTSVLFNYPLIAFARLPVSLTVSLSLLSATVLLTPPDPHSAHPTITVTLPSPQSELTLDVRTTSLLGSRAKLADVPKLHELITHQIRRLLLEKGTWTILLPRLGTVQEVLQDMKTEHEVSES